MGVGESMKIHTVNALYVANRHYQFGFEFMIGYRRIGVMAESFEGRPYITIMLPWWNIVFVF